MSHSWLLTTYKNFFNNPSQRSDLLLCVTSFSRLLRIQVDSNLKLSHKYVFYFHIKILHIFTILTLRRMKIYMWSHWHVPLYFCGQLFLDHLMSCKGDENLLKGGFTDWIIWHSLELVFGILHCRKELGPRGPRISHVKVHIVLKNECDFCSWWWCRIVTSKIDDNLPCAHL